MTFHYQTEYCLGRRARVHRTYSGIQALIPIAFDLILGLIFGMMGLIFGVIGLAMWLIRCVVLTTCRVAVALLSVPLRVARSITVRRSVRPVAKPAWAFFDEL
jgi:hypothetical protein